MTIRHVVLSGLIAAGTALSASQALAADLYEGTIDEYDQRYDRRDYSSPAPYDGEREPYRRPRHYGAYEDERPYGEREEGYGRRFACLSKREIRKKLRRQGWSNFKDVRLKRDAVVFTAARPNGLVYRLRIDTCDGVILRAELLKRPYSPYWRRKTAHSDVPAY